MNVVYISERTANSLTSVFMSVARARSFSAVSCTDVTYVLRFLASIFAGKDPCCVET